MSSLINIGLSGIRANQTALATTGQNITNASTPGYTRQRVNLETQVTGGAGTGGHGVRVQNVERIYDETAVNQVRLDTAAKSRLDTLTEQLSQVDSLLADEASSLNRGFEKFFAAFHAAADSPTSLAARQLVIAEAQGLVARFQSLDGKLRDQQDALNRQVESEMTEINRLAASIGELNARLGPMGKEDANTNALLDQRDELLRQLSERVDVKVAREGDLGMNVFIGKGQPLVVGTSVTELSLSHAGQVQIHTGEGASAVTLHGGSLGGLMSFRDHTLEPVMNDLGRLALGFAGTVNDVHARGLDLRGQAGGVLFNDINSPAAQAGRVAPANAAANRGVAELTVQVTDAAIIRATDYRLTITGDTYEIRRERDGEVVANGELAGEGASEVDFDGLRLRMGGGGFTSGAEFHIRAASGGVGNLGVAVADPRDLALASPLAISEGDANVGTGKVTLSDVNDVANPLFGDGKLVPPLSVRFTSPTSYEILDNSDPTNPRPLSPPIWGMPFVAGGEQPLLPAEGRQLLVADGRDNGGLPDGITRVRGLETVANRLSAETVSFLKTNPGLGNSTLIGQVDVEPGMSARAIAAALQGVDGVSAAARTELSLTGLRDNGLGQPLTVAVNGERLVLPAGSGLGDLADAVNASDTLRAAGISAKSDGETMTLTASRGDDLALHVAGDVSDGLTVNDVHGRSLTLNGSGPPQGGEEVYQTATVGGSVRLLMNEGVRVESESSLPGGGMFSAAPVALPAALGFQATVSGRPEAGDTFEISFNDAGNLDNHNALALANLQIEPTVGDPPANFSENYLEIVELVGVRTAGARTDAQAAANLLEQSVARRESISGVNLEEEAANLIRYEQAYNASARVVSVAREIFDTLLGAVG